MSHRLAGMVVALTGLVVLASCSKSSPSAPGPSTPTPTSITVSSAAAHVFLGAAETFTATVALSNGNVQPLVGGTWGTDAVGVATVGASTGLVTSQSSGEVTVFVDAQGLRGSKKITVVPNYAGIWSGTYQVSSCAQTGDFIAVDFCNSLFAVGAVLPVGFNLTQTALVVSGRTALGSAVSSPFTATAATTGSLTFPVNALIDTVTIAQTWQLNITQSGRLDGTFVQTWTEPTLAGQLVVGATLMGVAPSAAMSAAMPVTSSGGAGHRRSLREIATLVAGRR